jgi:uncharacterized membrane protein
LIGSRKLRNYFVAGVLVIAPTALSIWLLYRAFLWVDQLLGGPLQDLQVRGYHIPGVGFITVVAIILLVAGSSLINLFIYPICALDVFN